MAASRRVICIGNELCHDDGVASAIGRELEARGDALIDVDVVRVAEIGLACLDLFLDVAQVVLVDAVTTGNRPGSCSILDSLDFAPRPTCSVGHAVSLGSLLELVAELHGAERMPRVTIVGVEVEDLTPFGTTLSPAVLAAVPHAAELVMSALDS